MYSTINCYNISSVIAYVVAEKFYTYIESTFCSQNFLTIPMFYAIQGYNDVLSMSYLAMFTNYSRYVCLSSATHWFS